MHPSTGATRSSRAGAHHHQGHTAKRPWHKKMVLCCFAGANKPEDVTDPFDNTAALTGPLGDNTAATSSSAQAAHVTAQPVLQSSTVSPDSTTPHSATRRIACTLQSAPAVRPAGASAVPVSTLSSTAVPSDPPPPRAVGPASKLLDDVVTEPSSIILETSSGTASGRIAPQDLNLGSPLMTPSSSNAALAAAAAAGLSAQREIRTLDDHLVSSDRLAAGAAAAGDSGSYNKGDRTAAATPLVGSLTPTFRGQQQQQSKSSSPFLNQKQQQTVTAELIGLQMQEYRAQHSPEQQQQRKSLEQEQEKRRSFEQQQQQQQQYAASGSSAGDAMAMPGLSVRVAAINDVPQQQQQQGVSDQSTTAPAAKDQAATSAHPPKLSLLVPETSDLSDSSPLDQQQQQQQSGDSSSTWNVVPMTTGLKPPLSPLRIPSSSQNNLLHLISNHDSDLNDTPPSPRASVVGVSNSVINNLLSEEGIPLVPTEPGLAEALMDPLPESLEVTPETPKRVRSFAGVGGTSSNRLPPPRTPRVSHSGTFSYFGSAAAGVGTSGDNGDSQSDPRRKSLSGVTASPLRAGPGVGRGVGGDQQIMGGTRSDYFAGTRGGIRSDSNVIAGSYAGPGYVPRGSTAAAAGSSSNRAMLDQVESWDNNGSSSSRGRVLKYTNGSSSRPTQSVSFIEACSTPRAAGAAAAVGRKSLSFTYRTHAPAGSSSSGLRYMNTSSNPAAAAAAPANMSAANIAAIASFELSPPDDPNPSYHSNAVFTVTEPSSGSYNGKNNNNRSDESYLEDTHTGEFGGSSSSGPVETSDGGFATGNLVGSGALFSRSGLATFTKGSEGLRSDDKIGVLDVDRKSGVAGKGTVASSASNQAVV